MCSSCGACSAVCPKKAIAYESTNAGRIYATVGSNCIDCGLCCKVCPSEKKSYQKNGYYNEGIVESVRVGRSTNSTYYNNAQSGGDASPLLTIFLLKEKLMQQF